jgi:hypothetical protein
MIKPILNFEAKVQVQDATRFDAAKTFITKGENPISKVEITPGADGTPVDVFVVDEPAEERYLDWAWDNTDFDIGSVANTLYFKRKSTGVDYVVTIPDGTYTFTELKDEVLTQLQAAEAAITFDLTLSDKDALTLTTSEEIEIDPTKRPGNLWSYIGFQKVKSGKEFEGLTIEFAIKKITMAITTSDGANPGPPVEKTETVEYYQKVYTLFGDSLFSNDSDLQVHESNILNWVKEGRASFLDAHRRTQETILNWIYNQGHTDIDGERLTKYDILDLEDVRLWSIFETLRYLFMGFQNSSDDVHKEKAGEYEKEMIASRSQVMLKLDKNKNKKVDKQEKINTSSGDLIRR